MKFSRILRWKPKPGLHSLPLLLIFFFFTTTPVDLPALMGTWGITTASASPHAAFELVNTYKTQISFEHILTNTGSGTLAKVNVYLAIPEARSNQTIENLSFSMPYTLLTDQYGQKVAYFQFSNLLPGEQAKVSWQALTEISGLNYLLDPARVQSLDTISGDIRSLYTSNESMYRLDSPAIQAAAVEAAGGASHPYWVAMNIHDYVARKLTYSMDGQWEDAEKILLSGTGSCSEYTSLFIALCRANGIPARYVGSTIWRGEANPVDTVFHRWAEIYLAPYGWIPVDVTNDDREDADPVYTYFGAVSPSRLVTTVGGGNSEYLGWNYHSRYTYTYSSYTTVERTRSATWQLTEPELSIGPNPFVGGLSNQSPLTRLGQLTLTSTNASLEWKVSSEAKWIQLSSTSGNTPQRVEIFADATGMENGAYPALLEFEAVTSGQKIDVPFTLLVGHQVFLPAIEYWKP